MSNYQPLHRYDHFKISTCHRILTNLNSFHHLGTHHSYSVFVNTTPVDCLIHFTLQVKERERETFAIVPLAGSGVLFHKLAYEVIKSQGPWLQLVGENNEGMKRQQKSRDKRSIAANYTVRWPLEGEAKRLSESSELLIDIFLS